MRSAIALSLAVFLATAITAPVPNDSPIKRDVVQDTLTQLAVDHPDVKDAVEAVILAEYGGIRPAGKGDVV